MRIVLSYRNHKDRVLDAPFGMRHPKDGKRPYKAVLDKETWNKEFIRNKIALALDAKDMEGVTWQD